MGRDAGGGEAEGTPSGPIERLKVLKHAHEKGLITTGEYQMHKQRALHWSFVRPADSRTTPTSTEKGQSAGGGIESAAIASPGVPLEVIAPLVDALHRVAAGLEALSDVKLTDNELDDSNAADEGAATSTMVVLNANDGDTEQLGRALDAMGPEATQRRAPNAVMTARARGVLPSECKVGRAEHASETAPTNNRRKQPERKFAFDRHGRCALSSDDTDVPVVPIDPLQVDVRKLMLDDEEEHCAEAQEPRGVGQVPEAASRKNSPSMSQGALEHLRAEDRGAVFNLHKGCPQAPLRPDCVPEALLEDQRPDIQQECAEARDQQCEITHVPPALNGRAFHQTPFLHPQFVSDARLPKNLVARRPNMPRRGQHVQLAARISAAEDALRKH